MGVRVVYDHGVFRPLVPVDVEEGAEGEVSLISPKNSPLPAWEVGRILAAIAAMPSPNTDLVSAEDIDDVIYGGEVE